MEMENKVENRHSYGVIPITGTSDNWKLLLIDQKDSKLPHHWTFPKGTPEAGESPLETAIRETMEEVGIECTVIDPDFSYTEEYSFQHEDRTIEKKVTYFLGRADSEEYSLQEIEVQDARWVTLEEAIELVTFQNRTTVLTAIEQSGAVSRLLSLK